MKSIIKSIPKTEDYLILSTKEIQNYNIRYEIGAARLSGPNPTTYNEVDALYQSRVDLKAPFIPGYKFVGWYKEESFNNLVTKIDPKNGTNLELFARFTKLDLSERAVFSSL